jgi:hypothetical protein
MGMGRAKRKPWASSQPRPRRKTAWASAFGDDGEAQVVGHLDDGAHDGGVGLVLERVGDDRAVDLQRGDGEAGEVGEAGVAGAEVVDGDADAVGHQGMDDAPRVLGVVHELARGSRARGMAELAAGRRPVALEGSNRLAALDSLAARKAERVPSC